MSRQASYEVRAYCTNCNKDQYVKVPFGKPKPPTTTGPKCGCYTLKT